MTMITLAKALKLKKRIVQKLSQVQTDIAANNSTMVGAVKEVDVKALIDLRATLVASLIELKVKLATANLSIVPKILRLAELKSENTWLGTVGTQRGKVKRSSYSEEIDEFETVLTKADVDAKVKANEAVIDQLQEELDAYNATTKIDFIYEL